jgi:hypothetical protein
MFTLVNKISAESAPLGTVPDKFRRTMQPNGTAILLATLVSEFTIVLNNMLPVLILVASSVFLARFGFLAWRSRLLALTCKPLSPACQKIMARASSVPHEEDFERVALLLRICPGLQAEEEATLLCIRTYYRMVRWWLSHLASPSGRGWYWAARDMAACTHYLALTLDQKLRDNRLLLPETQRS